MPRGPMEDRVQDLGAVLDKVLNRIDKLSPMSGTMMSPVDIALSTRRDQIIEALERGFAPGTIARLLADADAPFAQETLRLGIVRIRDSAKATSRTESRRRRDSVPVGDVIASNRKRDSVAVPDAISDTIGSRSKHESDAEPKSALSPKASTLSSIAHLNTDV